MTTVSRPGPRERLLAAAVDLTYAHGVGVGIDAILREADVARRSLYQHFGGKDGLLVEVIRTSAEQERREFEAALESGGDDPRARILSAFDALAAAVSTPGFRGCRYIAADLALTDPAHPVHAETEEHRRSLHRMLATELDRLGHPAVAEAADELVFLIEGALVSGVTRPGSHGGRTARRLAEQVIAG
ncbi:MAG TPA: TetR/AcrR family transcriptional regulator [Micromonosporaceae bacterium]|nr:TetR/AcrR family transcriptional regulator [Micromonosporaceae bacterium]